MQSCKKNKSCFNQFPIEVMSAGAFLWAISNQKKVGVWVFQSSSPGPFDLHQEIPYKKNPSESWSLSLIFNLFSSDRRGGGAPPPFYDVKAVLLKLPTKLCVCVCVWVSVWIKARSQTHQYRRKWGAFVVSMCLLVCELMCVWEYLPFIDHIRDKHVEADKVWLWGFVYMCACPDLSKQRWRSVRNLTLGCLLTLDVLKYHAFPLLSQLKKQYTLK